MFKCIYSRSDLTKHQQNIRIDSELMQALQRIRESDGVPVSEQIRRGIVLWLESKGVKVKKAAPRRASTRRKA
jgi:hypothetical protein